MDYSSFTLFISLQHKNQKRTIALCKGISREELSEVFKAAFNLNHQVIAIEDQQGLVYPLSVISRDPSQFRSTYRLITRNTNTTSTSFASHSQVHSQVQPQVQRRPQVQTQSQPSHPTTSINEIPENDTEQVLQYLQNHTAFSRVPMVEILKVFGRATQDGGISKPNFERAFAQLMQKHQIDRTQDSRIVKMVGERIFDLFDRDKSGIVDFTEFVAGLSLLCRASSQDKIFAAFSLFDFDGDGFITLDEMVRYLSSFFEVCFALEPGMKDRFGGATAYEVGSATAEHCFRRADADGDGRITFEEFAKWYSSDDMIAGSSVFPH